MEPQALLTQAANIAAQVDPHLTAPNPRVGCVIVRAGKIIAQGVHEQYGGPHAEAHALQTCLGSSLGKETTKEGFLRDCEVFITLEPCHTFKGKQTPSCTSVLIAAQPKKVWVGALDPYFRGQSLQRLENAGIKTQLVKTEHHAQLNPFFATWITQQRPYICLKIAQTLDGSLTLGTNTPDLNSYKSGLKYITNEVSRQHVHQLRAQYTGILTTTTTVQTDNPQLDIRYKPALPHPTSSPRVIIMGQQSIDSSSQLYSRGQRQVNHLKTRDLNLLLDFCRQENIDSLLTECGGTMNAALLKAGLVDEIQIFIAPDLAGSHKTPTFKPAQEASALDLSAFRLVDQASLSDDLWLRYQRQSA